MPGVALKEQCRLKLNRVKQSIQPSESDQFCLHLLEIIERYVTPSKHIASEPESTDLCAKTLKSDASHPQTLENELLALLGRQIGQDQTSQIKQNFYQQLFNHSNDHLAILDSNSNFLNINPAYAKTVGYQNSDHLFGSSYEHFKGEAVTKANAFRNQDVVVFNTKQPLEFLSYHRYADDRWHLLHGEKICMFDTEQQPMGIFSKARDVTDSGLIDITRFLLQNQPTHFGRVSQQSFTYYISRMHDRFELSPKEKEIIFYFIRGKTAQNIADLLCRSKRTVEMHLESIKNKFQVETKSHLIEKAIIEGYMTMLPQHMLEKLT